MTPLLTRKIVDTLFPTQRVTNRVEPAGYDDIVPFSAEKLHEAARKLKERRAAGQDGIPAEVVKFTTRVHPQAVLSTMNGALNGGTFPPEEPSSTSSASS